MKNYLKPELEVRKYYVDDILCASGNPVETNPPGTAGTPTDNPDLDD